MRGDLVLVTGARGFVGWHVAAALLDAGAKVRGLTRSLRAQLPGIDPGIDWFEGDLLQPDSLAEALTNCRFLFHVAADHRYEMRNAESVHRSNVEGTKNILDAAWKAGVEKVVYTSSSGILAPKLGGERNEADVAKLTQLRSPYHTSKLLAYQEVEKRSKQGLPVVTVMPTAAIGPYDARPTPTGRVITEFLAGRMPFRLKAGLNCVAVRDVALGHVLALTRGISGQRYLIGCQNLWLHEFLAKLEPFTESRVSKITAPDWLALIYATVTDKMPIGRDGNSPGAVEALEAGRCARFSSSSKAISEIGYRPRGIDLAIREAVEYFKMKGMVL
jgi:dihydroflavonol-4-reductase